MFKFNCSECFKKDLECKDWYMVNDKIWKGLGFSTNVVCWCCLKEAVIHRFNKTLAADDFSQYSKTPLNLKNPEVMKLFHMKL